jgi:hypothetical protein
VPIEQTKTMARELIEEAGNKGKQRLVEQWELIEGMAIMQRLGVL